MLTKTLELILKQTNNKAVINTFETAINRIKELEEKVEERHSLIWLLVGERKLCFDKYNYVEMKEVNKKLIKLVSKSITEYKLLLSLYNYILLELKYYAILEERLKNICKD